MAVLKGESFHVNAKAKVMSAEASDLYGFYYNSVMVIRSQRTGRNAHFVFDQHVKDAEGELLYTRYVPFSEPELEGWAVFIYND